MEATCKTTTTMKQCEKKGEPVRDSKLETNVDQQKLEVERGGDREMQTLSNIDVERNRPGCSYRYNDDKTKATSELTCETKTGMKHCAKKGESVRDSKRESNVDQQKFEIERGGVRKKDESNKNCSKIVFNTQPFPTSSQNLLNFSNINIDKNQPDNNPNMKNFLKVRRVLFPDESENGSVAEQTNNSNLLRYDRAARQLHNKNHNPQPISLRFKNNMENISRVRKVLFSDKSDDIKKSKNIAKNFPSNSRNENRVAAKESANMLRLRNYDSQLCHNHKSPILWCSKMPKYITFSGLDPNPGTISNLCNIQKKVIYMPGCSSENMALNSSNTSIKNKRKIRRVLFPTETEEIKKFKGNPYSKSLQQAQDKRVPETEGFNKTTAVESGLREIDDVGSIGAPQQLDIKTILRSSDETAPLSSSINHHDEGNTLECQLDAFYQSQIVKYSARPLQWRLRLYGTSFPIIPIISRGGRQKGAKARRADLKFAVSRIHKDLKKGGFAKRVGDGAAVFLASVLEYLVTEVFELSGCAAKQNETDMITAREITIGVRTDEELSELLSSVIIPGGGVVARADTVFPLPTTVSPQESLDDN